MPASESGYDVIMTQLDIILVFAVVSWIGIILLAWNHGAKDFVTGETIAGFLIGATILGFVLIYYL